jgi:hypothetical protein
MSTIDSLSSTSPATSSTSFDSSNSFYSTTNSSNSASSLDSCHFEVADSHVFQETVQAEVAVRIEEVLREIENGHFQSLLDTPTVKIDSSTDPEKPFCFRVNANFPQQSPAAAFALFANVQDRPEWDDICQDVTLLRSIDPLTVIYHLKLKAQWPTTARDSLLLAAFRKLEDGRYITLAWSIQDDQLCPPDQNFVRMETRISANLFTPLSQNSFKLTQLIDGNPKGSIPAYLIKKVSAKSFPITIQRIKSAIQNYSEDFYNKTINPEETMEMDSEIIQLTKIRQRLNEIETKLNEIKKQQEQANNPLALILNWAPTVISTIILLKLFTIQKRNK